MKLTIDKCRVWRQLDNNYVVPTQSYEDDDERPRNTGGNARKQQNAVYDCGKKEKKINEKIVTKSFLV